MVSVIIPIYNTQATLARAIDSVLAQTMPASEIILVDDGSPDDAGAIADDYARRYPHIKVVHKANAGLAEARRTGINTSTAPLIMHLDSDDTLPPDAIEFLYDKLTTHNLDIAYGCYMRIPDVGKPHPLHHKREGVMTGEEFVELNMSLGSHNSSCCNLSRRELWTDGIFPPATPRMPSEDILININMGFNIERAGQWNHPTYCYHYNPESLSIVGNLWTLDGCKRYFAYLEQVLTQHGVIEQYRCHLHILKIDRLAFYISHLDGSAPWVRNVVDDYSHHHLPLKTRVLQLLLHFPRLCRACVVLNRRAKRLLRLYPPLFFE